MIDSDVTLVFFNGELSGGTKKSKTLARRLGKPYLMLDFAEIDLETAVDHTYSSIKELGLAEDQLLRPTCEQLARGARVVVRVYVAID